MTCEITASVTSSPGSVDGPSQPDLLGGPSTVRSGPDRAPANRSRVLARKPATTTNGTFGPTSFDCCVPAGPLSGWESRLRMRLARAGSTESWLTWTGSTTPAGRFHSRLAQSTRRTRVIVCGSSLVTALWITASARDWKDSPGMALARPDGRGRIDQLPRQVMAVAQAGRTTGSPATTAEPAALHPAFACWLMGFPLAWDACAPTEMPSSRPWPQR